MSRQPTFTERMRVQMDAAAVQEAEQNLANVNTGLGQKLGDAASGLAQTIALQDAFDEAGMKNNAAAYKGREWRGFEIADRRIQDNKAKAEAEALEKGGVEKLQTYFTEAGITTPASVFRKDIWKGYEFYEKEMTRQIDKEKQEHEAEVVGKILAHPGRKKVPIYGLQERDDFEDLDFIEEMDKATGGQGFGKMINHMDKVQTGEKEEAMSNMEIIQEVLAEEGMPFGMDAKKFGDFLKTISKLRGVQDDDSYGDMSKDEADRRKSVVAAKEAEAKWNNLSKGNLPINDEGRKGFKKQIESLVTDAYKFKAENAGLESMVEFFNQDPEKFETGAYDTSLVFQFMKALDPSSVVRESEFDTAAKSAGALEFAKNFFEKMTSGKFLGKNQRLEFMRIMTNVVDYRRRAINSQIDSLESRAPQLYYNKTDEATKEKVSAVLSNTLSDIPRIKVGKIKKTKPKPPKGKGLKNTDELPDI